MRTILTVFCLLYMTSVVSAQHTVVELVRVGQPVPDYVKAFDDQTYRHWVELHNHLAIETARRAADEFNSRQHTPPSTVVDTFDSQNSWFPYTYTTQIYERRNEWHGGPVLILNPYCREK